jgi:hypothetical protein
MPKAKTKTLKNPFNPLVRPANERIGCPRPLLEEQREELGLTVGGTPVFKDVNERGKVGLYKMEAGVQVLVKDLGTVKGLFEKAIHRASLMTPEDMEQLDMATLSHMEAASIHLAARASGGDLDAINMLMDRAIGKPKIVTENKNINLTIDDILTGAFDNETDTVVDTSLPRVQEEEDV